MKLFTLSISLLLLSIVTFAQSVCPSYFRRNNGNGACADGQLKLYYTTCPETAAIIDSVYTDGIKANVNFASPDASKCGSQGYIAYCVVGGNMPPAATWKIYFHNPGSVDPFGCLVPQLLSGTLPITIKTFSAKRNGVDVSLLWQTSYESNAKEFEIQRKSGNNFVTIGSLAATNNELGNSYSFIDNNKLNGISEYRLKLISKDGDVVYSEIRVVKSTGATIDFTIFPNPAVRNAKVYVADISQPTSVQVYDNAGRVVKVLTIKSGNTIEINNLQTGIYRVRLLNNISGESVTKTLTVIQ